MRILGRSSLHGLQIDRARRLIRCGKENTFFNIAHTSGLSVAVLAGVPIGVDVERIRSDVDVDRIAKRIFSDVEMRNFVTLGPDERRHRFFERWVRLEAQAKASGAGLLPMWASRAEHIRKPPLSYVGFEPSNGFLGCVAGPLTNPIDIRLRELSSAV
jgi:phosphopantetheinyl transferase (holo-ACP synthase)